MELEKWLSCLLYHFLMKITKAEVSDIESLFHAFENHIVQILDFRKKKKKEKRKKEGTSKKS